MSQEDKNEQVEVVDNTLAAVEMATDGADDNAEQSTVPVERPEIDAEDLPKLFEALLFVSGHPITLDKLCEIAKAEEEDAKKALESLKKSLEDRGASIELVEINGGFQLRTKDFFAPFIQELKRTRPRRLSPAALETLAVVAYRQPVVKSDIEGIRGVDVTPTLKTLLDRRFIRIIGYQATVGQPALYGTTDQFLEVFGLRSLADLPALKDLREINEDPGETTSEGGNEDETATAEEQPPVAANQ